MLCCAAYVKHSFCFFTVFGFTVCTAQWNRLKRCANEYFYNFCFFLREVSQRYSYEFPGLVGSRNRRGGGGVPFRVVFVCVCRVGLSQWQPKAHPVDKKYRRVYRHDKHAPDCWGGGGVHKPVSSCSCERAPVPHTRVCLLEVSLLFL